MSSSNSLNKNYQQHFCQTNSYLYTAEFPLNVFRGVLQKDQEIQYAMGYFMPCVVPLRLPQAVEST